MKKLTDEEAAKVKLVGKRVSELRRKENEMDKGKIGFEYKFRLFGVDGKIKDEWTETNLIPDVGVAYLLGSALAGTSQLTTWYMGLYEANRTPVAGDTMTLLIADCSETTDYTTSGNARLTIVPDAIAAGVWSNAGHPLEFTFSAAATLYGSFITSGQTRSATAGLLLSATKWSSTKSPAIGEKLQVVAGLTLVTV